LNLAALAADSATVPTENANKADLDGSIATAAE